MIGLAIGFGAQSLVADLITGLFIIIEDSLSIDDYVDVGGHLGTVEGLTIRTVRLRDLDGVVHTIPFSEIKSIKNYSRQFGYAMFRWPVPASMPIDDAVALVREVAMERAATRRSTATCGRRWNCRAWRVSTTARRSCASASRPRRSSSGRSSGRSTCACVGASTRPASNCPCRVSTYS